MNNLINKEVVRESTRFVIDKLINDPTYNFFNNASVVQQLEDAWNREFPSINGNESSTEDKLNVNRKKLALKISNYHCLNVDISNMSFDDSYIASELYQKDFQDAYRNVKNCITTCYGPLITVTSANLREELDENEILSSMWSLFEISSSFCRPLPTYRGLTTEKIQQGKGENTKKLPSNFTSSRTLFDSYLHINPILQEINSDYIDERIQFFEVNKSSLQKYYHTTSLMGSTSTNEAIVSSLIMQFSLNVVISFLSTRFAKVELLQQISEFKKIIPDFGIQVNSNFNIPTEIKNSGIRAAYESRGSSQTKLNELLNQVIYQLMSYKSSFGFAIDLGGVLVVEIPRGSVGERRRTLEGTVLDLRLNVGYFSSKSYNLAALLSVLSSYYFTNVTHQNRTRITKLFKKAKLDIADRKAYDQWRRNFLIDDWNSHFENYTAEEEEFLHNSYPGLKIPSKCYEITNGISYESEALLEKDYTVLGSLRPQGVSKKGQYFSQVSLVVPNDGPNKGTKMVLKVYNPSMSPQSSGFSPVKNFLEIYSFILSMFLFEVRAYKHLRDTQPLGASTKRPDSSSSIGDVKNHVPYLYQYGICNWRNSHYQGFYLLIEYLQDDSASISPEELLKSADLALKTIHDKNILHGDIHRQNFIYDKKKKRVVFFDFGLSTMISFKFPERLWDENQKKIELAKLKEACGTRKRNLDEVD